MSKTMGEGDRGRANAIFSMLIQFTLLLSFVFMVPMLVLKAFLTKPEGLGVRGHAPVAPGGVSRRLRGRTGSTNKTGPANAEPDVCGA